MQRLSDLNLQQIKNLSLEQVLAAVEAGDISEPYVITIPLDTATNEKQFSMAGNYFGIYDATDVNTKIKVRFNRSNDTQVEIGMGQSFIRPIKRFFLSWDAQSGETITLLVAALAPDLFAYLDQRSNILQAQYLSDILDQLKGDTGGTDGADVSVSTHVKVITGADTTHAICLYADPGNTAGIAIGFTESVSATNKILILQPGETFMIDDFIGNIYAEAVSGTQKLSASLW